MYNFRAETDYAAFDKFVSDNKGQYQQCSLWPKVKTAWNPYLYSGFDASGERVLSCLVLERKLPLAGKLWYVPYGTVSDIANETLQTEFTDFIRGEMKAHNAFCTIIDPPVPIRIDGERVEAGHDAHKLLTSLGYELNTDLDSYTYKHPVQTMIPLRDENGDLIPADKILKGCEKGVRYSVRVGLSRGLEHEKFTYDEIKDRPDVLEDFMSVMGDTSDRNSFVNRDSEYIMTLMGTLADYTDINLVYYNKALDTKLQNERLEKKAELENKLETAPEKKKKGILNDIDAIDKNTKQYEQRMEETKDIAPDARIVVAGGLTIRYGGFASCVFGGTRNIVRNNTRSSHYLNYLRICDSIEAGCDFHDLGYVLCDNPETPEADGALGPLSPRENFVGINSFKLSFGAKYTEYIGEYILVGNKFRYFIYKELMPFAKHLKMKLVFMLRKKSHENS